ncbi:MAG: hypothetical protein IPH13_04935 [Planctomycetes bacterium]|nr:hypothetical protein [Planctomycetota bacterium]MCC7172648.1 hypothetical protein [Planctomycetota bacterium]
MDGSDRHAGARRAAGVGLVAAVACVLVGGLAVWSGETEPWSGTHDPWRVFQSFATPVPVAIGTLHWASLAPTLILLVSHWSGRIRRARAIFVLALIGAGISRVVAGREQFELFVAADAIVGILVTSIGRSAPARPQSNA